MLFFISAFLSIVYSETKRLVKSFLPSYIWFIVLVSVSTYSLFTQTYSDSKIDRSLMQSGYANNPMTDILLYIISFAVKSSSSIMSGKIPTMIFPVSIGVIFFILFPFMLSLTFMGNMIIKKGSTMISGEVERKTLYIMVGSPMTRSSIYIGKFIGLLLSTLPVMLLFYFITDRVFTSVFTSADNLSIPVIKVLFINAVLFTSAGMFVSAVLKNEKVAIWSGKKIIAVSAALTSFYIFIPFIEFLLNITNNGAGYLAYLEKVTWISPFTIELMSVYDPSLFPAYFNILIAVSVILILLGMVTFIRQDLEY